MMYPVTKIVFTNSSDVEIAVFEKTMKSKDVNIKFSKEKTVINRKYNNRDKQIFTKEVVTAEFSVFNDFTLMKELNPDTEEISFFEGIKVSLLNSKRNTNLELYNCNVDTSSDVNLKHNGDASTTFKIDSQGTSGKYWGMLAIE